MRKQLKSGISILCIAVLAISCGCREGKQQPNANEKELDQEIEKLLQKIQPDLSEMMDIPSSDNPGESEEEKAMYKLTKCSLSLVLRKGVRVAVRWLKSEPLEELEKDLQELHEGQTLLEKVPLSGSEDQDKAVEMGKKIASYLIELYELLVKYKK